MKHPACRAGPCSAAWPPLLQGLPGPPGHRCRRAPVAISVMDVGGALALLQPAF